MPELSTPTGYRIPLLQQEFKAAPVGPLVPDQRGAAKAALWGSIAKAISNLPKTLIDSYKAGQEIRRDTAKEKDRVAAEESKRTREAFLTQKLQEATIPSAVSVDSPANAALGISPGIAGGVAQGKPALADFSVTPNGIVYAPEDPALAQAKVQYYKAKALEGFGKTKEEHGINFPSAEAALAGGYNPEGADINPDGTITVKTVKSREEKSKRLTEGEQKTKTYVTRAQAANDNVAKILETYDPTSGVGAAETLGNKIPILGNMFVSSEQQKLKQAVDEFATAILRKDTGAAITKGEREEVYRTYIPQPGDKPEVMAQKKEARQRAIDALRESLPQADQRADAAAHATAPSTASTPATPTAATTTPTATEKADVNAQIRVKSPAGKTGYIPAAQLQAALSKGYTLIE